MSRLTRRGFLTGSLGAAAGVTVAAVLAPLPKGLFGARDTAGVSRIAGGGSVPPTSGAVVAYVRDVRRGEITLLVGTREIKQRDPDLARRLVAAAS